MPPINPALTYFDAVQAILNRIRSTQMEMIQRPAQGVE